jgi:cobalt-zinc-cadmium efflux system membrane fusion protein
MTRYFPGWIIAVAVLFLASCNHKKAPETDDPRFVISDSLLKTIRIDTVITCPLVNTLTLTGKISYNEENVAKIFPLVTGVVSDIKVQLGDYVQKGQALGAIRSVEMAGYANDLITARTNLVTAKKNLDATQEMFNGQLVSERDLVNAKVAYQQAEAQVTKATNVLQINGGNTKSEFVIKAPVNGFIVEKQVTNNMSIRSDNATSLFTISDLKNVWVWANVYESNIDQVHLNDSVQVTTLSYPGQVFHGKIDKIVNVLDPVNKVMKVRVVLPNSKFMLKPEMFASVMLTNKTTHTSALCVPSEALIFDRSQHFVLVYKSQSDVQIVPVEVLSEYGNSSFITGDVQPGDKIISSNTVLIYQSLNG